MMQLAYDRANPTGYTIKLSPRDTYAWAHRPGAAWPCSTLAGHRLVVVCDRNGLCDLMIDGRNSGTGAECDGEELVAIVVDHLPPRLRHFWPCWE